MTSPSRPPKPATQDPDRRFWLLATTAMGTVGTVGTAVPFVASFAPSERAKALGASVEVDIGNLPPGGVMTVEWRGKPVWILRRTPEMQASLKNMPGLADPESKRKDQQPEYARNPTRSIRPDVLVMVGICTHLGCSPVLMPEGTNNPSLPPGWKGGFFCPCHGSTFDFAGRVFRNKPAPTNLEVPRHQYLTENKLVIGEDDKGKAA